MHFLRLAPAFAVVAGWTCGHYIGPDMLSTQVLWQNMIHCQIADMTTAILAGVIITTEDFPAGQLDLKTGSVDHLVQPDNRRSGSGLFDSLDITAAVHYQIGLP